MGPLWAAHCPAGGTKSVHRRRCEMDFSSTNVGYTHLYAEAVLPGGGQTWMLKNMEPRLSSQQRHSWFCGLHAKGVSPVCDASRWTYLQQRLWPQPRQTRAIQYGKRGINTRPCPGSHNFIVWNRNPESG